MTTTKPNADKPAKETTQEAGHEFDPRAELGLKRPAQADEQEARENEPYGPGQYRSGVDKPGEPTKKNPGHTNPRHNTPGHERHDKPDQAEPPGQEQSASYPGIMGPKARALKQDSKPPTEPTAEKHPETIHPRTDNHRTKK